MRLIKGYWGSECNFKYWGQSAILDFLIEIRFIKRGKSKSGFEIIERK